MKICRTISELQNAVDEIKQQGKTIGFVPTMGALHDGHVSLFKRAAEENDIFAASVFVNPVQFNNKEDFEKYPRTEQEDLNILEQNNCALVFIPSAEEVYKEGTPEHWSFGQLEQVMEGKQRPGHFSGVANIVSRLFTWVRPDRAYFGEKDYQQIAIIKDMVRQMNSNVEIVPCPIYREADGLAASSRNKRLSPQARQIAPKIHDILTKSYQQREFLSLSQIKSFVENEFKKYKEFELEYFILADGNTLQPVKVKQAGQSVIGFIAVWLDGVRLIDIQKYF
ncbi:MAG: pantoate--beta-alanine ligase [Bacteroidales bacterium]|nr:pantoate--beta-alanine ligase [Bacteroidales bacterium]